MGNKRKIVEKQIANPKNNDELIPNFMNISPEKKNTETKPWISTRILQIMTKNNNS